jgi:nucleotide-binding universal stress UspA family protein
MKVLVATDSVECSRRVIPEIQRLFAGQPLEVILVGVEEEASGLERLVPVAGTIIEAQSDELRRGLVEARALLAGPGVEAREIVRRGRPGPTIVTVAEELQPDLIVVGAQGFGPVMRAVMGSVSTHVVHHWPGATLVVKGV